MTVKNTEQFIEAIKRLDAHDHLCLIYSSKEEEYAAVVPFIRIGLERGERCVYIADDNTITEVLDVMRNSGIDIDSFIKSEAFIIVTKKGVYLKEGYFDPGFMIDFLKKNIEEAKKAGFPVLRVISKMTWIFGNEVDVELLIEYESKLNYFLPENDIVLIGQYEYDRFDPEIIYKVIETHPLVIYKYSINKNIYYIPPDEFKKPEQGKKRVERLLKNIYDREKAEDALHKSEAEFKEAQRVGRLGSWDWDAITDTITWSEEYYYIYGLDPKQRPPGYEEHLKAYTPESAARLDVAVKRNLQTGESYEVDLELADPKGPCRWITARSETRRDARGKITGLRGTAQDITERKKAEEAVKKSEEYYRTLIENIDLGICLIDKDYRFVTINSAFGKMFGVLKDEITGKYCFEVCAKSSSLCPYCPGAEAMNLKKAVRLESECVCFDGTRLPVILHTYPVLDANNDATAFIKISEDITEYKKVEQAKKNLIRDMSHTLKTPIAMTEMAFDIIKKSIDSNDKESIKKANKIASENLAKLRKDVTNILQEFSMDVHKDIIGKKDKTVSLNAAMADIANNLKIVLENKNIQLEINIPADADKIKMEDRDIQTVLNNLLDNAVKFTDKGKISVISRLKGEMVEIEVKDTGCGISAKDINRVFDKFYKRHASIDGTGLGLSICRELVEMYSGEINIYSEGVGKGARVVFSLPAA